jgi:integrase/recombinase XerC
VNAQETLAIQIDDLYAERDYSPSTQSAYRRLLKLLAAWLDDKALGLEDLTPREFIAFLDSRTQWGSSMRYQCFRAMRTFWRWRFGDDHVALRAKVRRLEAGPQRVLSEEEVVKLLGYLTGKAQGKTRLRKVITYVQETSPDPKATRDLGIVSLALDTGIRASEICRLARDQVDMAKRTISVRVKGSRWRTAVFSEATGRRLEDWLRVRPQCDTPNLFVSLGGNRGGHTAAGGPLTNDGLRVLIRYIAQDSGLDHFGPHALRRTMATLAAKKGASSRLIQVMGGWSSIELVEVYTRSLTPQDAAPYLVTATIGNSEPTDKSERSTP